MSPRGQKYGVFYQRCSKIKMSKFNSRKELLSLYFAKELLSLYVFEKL